MGLVWAGSQVTKAPRAAAALMLAPLVDRGMAWLQRILGLRTRRSVRLGRLPGLSQASTGFGVPACRPAGGRSVRSVTRGALTVLRLAQEGRSGGAV